MGTPKRPPNRRNNSTKRGVNIGGYHDSTGRFRKVDTVDDYARILEYSTKRQLRHMEESFDTKHDEASELIYERLNSLMQKAFKS